MWEFRCFYVAAEAAGRGSAENSPKRKLPNAAIAGCHFLIQTCRDFFYSRKNDITMSEKEKACPLSE